MLPGPTPPTPATGHRGYVGLVRASPRVFAPASESLDGTHFPGMTEEIGGRHPGQILGMLGNGGRSQPLTSQQGDWRVSLSLWASASWLAQCLFGGVVVGVWTEAGWGWGGGGAAGSNPC